MNKKGQFAVVLTVLLSIQLMGQTELDNEGFVEVKKYKYILENVELSELDSTRRLDPNDLDIVETFNHEGNIIRLDQYKNGKIIGSQVYGTDGDEQDLQKQSTVDSTLLRKEIDSRSMYGSATKGLNEMGWNTGTSEDTYDARYTANGDLLAEFVMDKNGDTIRTIKHYYDDSNNLLRTENYLRGDHINTRIFVGGKGENSWSRIILLGETGQIESDDWTRINKVDKYVSSGESIFRWGPGEESLASSKALYFKNDAGDTIKAVFEIGNELLVIEYLKTKSKR